MKRPPRLLLYVLVSFLISAAPTAFAQHYYSGGGQIALTPIEGQYVVEAAPGVDEAALTQSLGSDFTITESLPRDFYVVEAASGLKGSQAEALLDSNTSVVRHHPDFHVGSSTMGFTITDYVRAGFGPGVTGAQVAQLNAQYGATTVDSETFADGASVYTLRVPAGGSYTTLEVANAYYLDSLTDWAVPDAYVELTLHHGSPPSRPALPPSLLLAGSIDDPLYPDQWNLENTGQEGAVPDVDIDADLAWNITRGSASVTVAVLDSGVGNHADFAQGQLLPNGWTPPHFLEDDVCPPEVTVGEGGTPPTGQTHGQSVAGLVAADFNEIGIRGVTEGATILGVLVTTTDGVCYSLPLSDLAAAVDTARVRGADIMNHSYGIETPNFRNDDVEHAFARAGSLGRDGKGTVMVAAAGNTASPSLPNGFVTFPATIEGVLTVSAVTSNNLRAYYSPRTVPVTIDVVAPSSDGFGGNGLRVTSMSLGDGYTSTFGGTSAASPQAAGIAALILSIAPDLTAAQVRDLIEQTADLDAGYNRFWAGNGRVNAYEALVRTLELYGGTLAQDVTVPAGETWDLGAVALAFAPGTRLIVEGTLNADGTTFTERDAGQGWGGIVVAGTLDADNVTVEYAYTGVTVYEPGTATIANSTLRLNGTGLDTRSAAGTVVTGSTVEQNKTGVQTGFLDCYGTTCPCFSSCRSALDLVDSVVRDNVYAGVSVIDADADITFTEITGNGTSGLDVSNADVDPFTNNVIENNGGAGVSVLAGGDVLMSPQLIGFGRNRVAGNAAAEVAVYSGGVAFLGSSQSNGRNSVYDANGGTLALNYSGAAIQAVNTYWDAFDAPPPGAFAGSKPVVWSPVSNCDYTVDPPACLGSNSRTGGRGTATEASAERGGPLYPGGPEALAEAIAELRTTLAADPASAEAPQRTRELGALHRHDRGDALGEWAATAALLGELRAMLGEADVPEALRATAEAALEVEALAAVGREDYAATEALLAEWAPLVASASVARALTLVDAHLDAADGDYEGASALVETAAASEPEDEAQAALWALAEVYAVRAGAENVSARGSGGRGATAAVAGRKGATAGAGVSVETAAAPTEASLVVYPNPSSGRVVVAVGVPETAEVRVVVYDVLGRRIATLAEGALEAGTHWLAFDGSRFPAGLYLVRAEVNGPGRTRAFTERLTVVR